MADEERELLLRIRAEGQREVKALRDELERLQQKIGEQARILRLQDKASKEVTQAYQKHRKEAGLLKQELVPLVNEEKKDEQAKKKQTRATDDLIKRERMLLTARREMNREMKRRATQNVRQQQMMVRARQEMDRDFAKRRMQQGQGVGGFFGGGSRLGSFLAGETRGARLFSDAMGLMAGNVLRLGVTMGALVIAGRVVADMFRKLGEIMDRPIKAAATLERHTIRFIALLQDEAAAIKRVGELADFSFSTPFELQQVVDAGAILEGFSLGAQVHLKRAANMAAAFGTSIEDAALALGKLRLGQFERLERFGITRPIIAERMGVELKEIRTNTPKVLAEIWEEATQMIDQKVKGAADMLAESYEGLESNIRGMWERINLTIADMGAFDARKQALMAELEIVTDIHAEYQRLASSAIGVTAVTAMQRLWGEAKTFDEWVRRGTLRLITLGVVLHDIAMTIPMLPLAGIARGVSLLPGVDVEFTTILEKRIEQQKAINRERAGEMRLQLEQAGLAQNTLGYMAEQSKWMQLAEATQVAINARKKEGLDLFKELRDAAEKQQEQLELRLQWLQGEGRLYDAQAKAVQMRISQENKLNQQLARRLELIREFGSVQRGVFMTMGRGEAPGAIRERTPLQPGVAEGLRFQETFPGAEGAARGAEAVAALAEALERVREQYGDLSPAALLWAETHKEVVEGISMGAENAVGMMGDTWDLYFSKSLKAGEEWSMAMDALFRGLGAGWLEILSEVAKKQGKMWIIEAGAALWQGNLVKAAGLAAKGTAMLALAGGIAGAGQAMISGSQVATFQGSQDPDEARKKEKQAQKRGLISMRGAAPITYNITINTYFNAPVMAMNPQQFADKTLRPVIEDTLFRVGAA